MKRKTLWALLVCVLVPGLVWAHYHWCSNEHGSISISMSGIVTPGSQLTYLFGIVPPKGHSLGLVIFSTGPMLTGNLETGATFDSAGSSFNVISKGNYGEPKGVIFSGTFDRPITWTLISHTGANLAFKIHGDLIGQTYTGATVTGETSQMIVTTEDQLAEGIGHIALGKMDVAP